MLLVAVVLVVFIIECVRRWRRLLEWVLAKRGVEVGNSYGENYCEEDSLGEDKTQPENDKILFFFSYWIESELEQGARRFSWS